MAKGSKGSKGTDGFKNGLKKVGRVWHYKFKMRGKEYHASTHVESKQDARQMLDSIRAEKAKQPYGLGTPPTVKVVYEAYCRDKVSQIEEKSMESFKSTITHWVLPLIGSLRVDRLKSADIAEIGTAYLATTLPNGKKHSKGGMKATLIATRTLLNYAVKSGLVASLPVKVTLPKLQERPIQAVSGSQVAEFMSTLETMEGIPQQVVLAIEAMLLMGLRISEVVGMKWEWFDPDMAFYTPGKTKGKEAVEIPVVDHLTELLKGWRATCEVVWGAKSKPMPPWVFHRSDGNPQSNSFANGWICKLAEALKLPGKWTPHKMRASCATILNELGVPSFIIQKILRHKNLGTTLFYARTDRDAMRAGLQKLSDRAFPEKARAATSSLPPTTNPMSDQDLDTIRNLLPAGVHDAVVRPLMLAGMSEAEAIVTAIRQERTAPAS